MGFFVMCFAHSDSWRLMWKRKKCRMCSEHSTPLIYRGTRRFVPDSLKLRTARFELAHRRFSELSHIDHAIKLCPLFVDLGDKARSGVQKCSKTICTDIQCESSSHQHLQIPGTYVQYPGLQSGSALGDASTPGTQAGSIASSAHGGTYSHVAVAGGA